MSPLVLDPSSSTGIKALPGGVRGRVLVVDDEPSVREFIGAAMKAGGYHEVLYLSGGTGVLSLALSERPQLIIMDVMMPCGNGMRALRALRNHPATAGIPVIMTSGFNVPAPDGGAAGRADYRLAKPFTVEQLLAAVSQVMAA
jgi:CheY-like chemotaxis protein